MPSANDDDEWNRLSPQTRERAAQFTRRLALESVELVKRCTVPFYGIQNNRLVQDRSAVLLQVHNDHFMLTAAHDLLNFVDYKIPLGINPIQNGPPIMLNKCRFIAWDNTARDTAVIHLTEEVAHAMKGWYQFLRLPDLDLWATQEETNYLLRGYPLDLSQSRPSSSSGLHLAEPLHYLTVPHTGELAQDDVTMPDDHIRLYYDKLTRLDAGREHAPRPRGLSGCGVWRLCRLTKDMDQTWKPEHIKLVAIQNWYYRRERYVKGTWIRFAVELIWGQYPLLRPAIELHYVPH